MSTVVTETPSKELAKLATDIRRAGGAISRELGQGLKAAADVVARDARANASWSTRIPGAIKVRTSRSTRYPGADIVVSGPPHARLFEGLTSGGGRSFRHKVFGNPSNWVSQETRPYIRPAFRANRKKFRTACDSAVRDVARKHGWSS